MAVYIVSPIVQVIGQFIWNEISLSFQDSNQKILSTLTHFYFGYLARNSPMQA